MKLNETDHEARTVLEGGERIVLEAGKRLQVRTGLPIVELLDEEVPAGKRWEAEIVIHIIETSV